jgi:predicted RNase H-like HicB family nuclease
MEKLYRIEELMTGGWDILDGNSKGLTREQAKARLEEAIAEGLNPNRLRAIPDRNV